MKQMTIEKFDPNNSDEFDILIRNNNGWISVDERCKVLYWQPLPELPKE